MTTQHFCKKSLTGLLPVSLALILLLLVGSISQAQVLYGSITGNVADSGGAVVPGATVIIIHKETGQAREGVTDANGSYDFPTVLAGTYTIKVSKTGFKTTSKDNVTVTLNTVTRADIAVEVGQVSETVIITAEAALLKTDRAEVSAELTSKPLQNLPVPLGRNYQNLFKTLPGITPPENAHSIPSNPSRSLVFNVNGSSRSSNNTRIDGASSTNLWLPHITAYVPALESIETVNVVTNSFDAEQGLAGGAAISVQIKSGTNDFHGSAFEYHNNQHLNARNFFYPLETRNGQPVLRNKSKLINNQYGATFGGPIIRNKLFFFTSWEGTKDRQNAARANLSVPTAPLRTGDLRAAPNIIYDPFDANGNYIADPLLRKQVECNGVKNVICANRINPISKKIIDLVPLPNQGTGQQSNYFNSAPFIFDRDTLDTKVNWNISEKFNLFGRYSLLHFFTFNEATFGPKLQGAPINGGNPGTGEGNTHSFSVGGTYTFTQNFIVDANFGFVRMGTGVAHSDIGEKVGQTFLGIPGTNGDKPYEGGFPLFDVGGYERYGITETYMPYYRSDDQYQYVANANWLKGAHNLRFGMDLYFQQLNHTQPEFLGSSLGARGGFVFRQGVTQACLELNPNGTCKTTSTGNNFNSWAAFLLGLPNQVGRLAETIAPYTTRNKAYSFYVRDQWQVNQRFTFSLGTRYEYFPIPTRADRGLERYNVRTNKVEIGGVGSVPENLGVEVSKGLFAPRIGLAYRFGANFVVRAGYGLTNDPYALARPMRTNHPVLINLNVDAPNSFGFARRLEDGIPLISVPGLGNGIIDIPLNVAAVTLPDRLDRGYIQSWNLSLQKELGWGFTGEVAYIGTRQIRQLGLLNLNYGTIGGGQASQILNKQFGRVAQTQLVTPVGNSHYDAMQARLDRRFRDFYQLNVNYTWSKSITTGAVSDSDNTLPISIPEFYHLNRTVSGFDRTHNLQITNIIELPFGKGRKYLSGSNGFVNALVSGWQVNNIISFWSGTPFSVMAPGTSLNAPFNSQRADVVKSGEVAKPKAIGDAGVWFDTTAFAQVRDSRFGTAAFNVLRGPGYGNWDFGLFRRFQITERFDLQFRAESFNFTNTPHFNNPNGDTSNATNYGRVRGAFGERQFRFGLRLGF
jgi:hypothetical protein